MPFTAIDVLTAVLVVITGYYAWQTRNLAQLTKETIDIARLAEDTQVRSFRVTTSFGEFCTVARR